VFRRVGKYTGAGRELAGGASIPCAAPEVLAASKARIETQPTTPVRGAFARGITPFWRPEGQSPSGLRRPCATGEMPDPPIHSWHVTLTAFHDTSRPPGLLISIRS
jgi:hypothetical protein